MHSDALAHQSMQEAPVSCVSQKPQDGQRASGSSDQISTSVWQFGQSAYSGLGSRNLIEPGQPLVKLFNATSTVSPAI